MSINSITNLMREKNPNFQLGGFYLYIHLIYGCFLKWWYPHFTPQNDHFLVGKTYGCCWGNPPFLGFTPISHITHLLHHPMSSTHTSSPNTEPEAVNLHSLQCARRYLSPSHPTEAKAGGPLPPRLEPLLRCCWVRDAARDETNQSNNREFETMSVSNLQNHNEKKKRAHPLPKTMKILHKTLYKKHIH